MRTFESGTSWIENQFVGAAFSNMRAAFAQAHEEYGLDEEEFPLEALLSLVVTFNIGIEVEQLSGIREGHRELLAWVDGWLERLEDGRKDKDVRGRAD